MSPSRIVLVLLWGLASSSAMADALTCPDLSTAMQVGSCPTEQDLKYTHIGYCSDNRRLYDKETGPCANYQDYRRLKNVALWEAGNSAFHGYLSCDLAPATIKAAKTAHIEVRTQGKITRVVCHYEGGITLTHRTRAECRVEGDGDCAANPAGCKAVCRD